jgi:glycine/D-amino acid oxidase-like deaminating enzyme
MKDTNANVVICGAGIAGIAAAYYLTEQGIDGILLIDQDAPLSLTSDKSTESYRDWWPGPDGAMLALMNRSIETSRSSIIIHSTLIGGDMFMQPLTPSTSLNSDRLLSE